MGSLILETRARDGGYEEADFRRAALLDVVRSDPFMLGPVTIQVANPSYGGAVELERWSRTLQTQPAILEAFLCRAPTYTPEVDRRIPNQIPWHVLRNPSPRERILDTCRRTPPNDVASFLRYAERHESDAVRTLVRALLQDGDFRSLLGRTPPNDVASFLRYAERHESDAVRTLLRDLLQGGDFRALLGRTSTEHVASFLQYAERHESEAVRSLLRNLLATPDFARTAVGTPAGHLAGFALFALERVKKEASPWLCTVLALPGAHPMIRAAKPADLTALVRAVCSTSDDSAATLAARLLRDWWSAFRSGVCPDGHELVACGPIVRLAHDLAPEVADELVSWLNSFENQFVKAVHPVPLVPRLGLALALRDTERWLAPPLWEALSRGPTDELS